MCNSLLVVGAAYPLATVHVHVHYYVYILYNNC